MQIIINTANTAEGEAPRVAGETATTRGATGATDGGPPSAELLEAVASTIAGSTARAGDGADAGPPPEWLLDALRGPREVQRISTGLVGGGGQPGEARRAQGAPQTGRA